MKLKNRLFIIDILILIVIYGIPLAIIGGCGIIPVGIKSIMFYAILAVAIFAHEFWVISVYKKDGFVEDALIFPQLKLSYLILLLPFLNLALYYIPWSEDAMKWYWITTSIINLLALVAYFVAYSLLAHVSNKMGNALKSHQSEKIEAVSTKSYETDDGDFFGSSARRK